MHLGGVVELAGECDVLFGDQAAARVLVDVAGVEVFEERIAVRQVRLRFVVTAAIVGRDSGRALDLRLLFELALLSWRREVVLPDLHLALERDHDLAALIAEPVHG